MSRIGASALAAAAAAFLLAAAGAAATITVQIRSTGFSPSTITINHDDKVTWHNADKVNHQVVANDGSFASPIIDYGTQVMLNGTISTGAVNSSVEIDQQPWGQPSPTQVAVVKTGANGAFSYPVTPTIYTTYVARWGKVASGNVVVQVAPKLRLLVGGGGYMKAVVSAPMSMWHRHLFLQRRSPFGQWVNIAALTLGPQNGRIFRPAAYVPKGISHVRVFLSVNQAGNGLLAAHSGTQTVRRIR